MPDNIRTERIAAVIAAAGFSSRMKDFKPLMPFAQSTVIGTVIKAFQAAGINDVVVVCGYRGDELARYVEALGARPVFNENYAESGMFESLKCGITALHSEIHRCFLTPGDVPLISEALIRVLMRSKANWAVPAYGERQGHPVIVSANMLHSLTVYDGADGLRGALNTLPFDGERIPWNDEAVLLDADTPEDYRRLCDVLQER